MTDRELYSPGNAHGAQALIEGEKMTLVLIRVLRHSPQKVWEALTEPGHLREWAPFDADSSLAKAGTPVKLTTLGGPAPRATEEKVLRAEAPALLEYTWGGRSMRWELEAMGSGTRLTLWANIEGRFIAMGASGWHICLDVLDRLLGGKPIGRIVGGDAMLLEGWRGLLADYASQLGVEVPIWPPRPVDKPQT
jgi:uncharacterized protein YndB with AHSA1/START domain